MKKIKITILMVVLLVLGAVFSVYSAESIQKKTDLTLQELKKTELIHSYEMFG